MWKETVFKYDTSSRIVFKYSFHHHRACKTPRCVQCLEQTYWLQSSSFFLSYGEIDQSDMVIGHHYRSWVTLSHLSWFLLCLLLLKFNIEDTVWLILIFTGWCGNANISSVFFFFFFSFLYHLHQPMLIQACNRKSVLGMDLPINSPAARDLFLGKHMERQICG